MPGVDPSSRVSEIEIDSVKRLSRQLDKLYEKLATGINSKRDTFIRSRAPTASDVDYQVGSIWVDDSADKAYILTSRTSVTVVVWSEIT